MFPEQLTELIKFFSFDLIYGLLVNPIWAENNYHNDKQRHTIRNCHNFKRPMGSAPTSRTWQARTLLLCYGRSPSLSTKISQASSLVSAANGFTTSITKSLPSQSSV